MGIRFVPKTAAGRGWDPFTSILYALNLNAQKGDWGKIIVTYDGVTCEYPFDGNYHPTPFSVDQRKKFAATPFVTLSAKVVLQDGSDQPWNLKIAHKGETIPFLGRKVDDLTNADFDGEEGCYPEALNPGYSRKRVHEGFNASRILSGGRPCMAYLIVSASDGEVTVLGPHYAGFDKESKFFGMIDLDQTQQMAVYVDDPRSIGYDEGVRDEPTVQPGPVVQQGDAYLNGAYFLTPDGVKFPIVFAQSSINITGRLVSYESFLKALQIVVVHELSREHNPDLGKLAMTLEDANGDICIPIFQRNSRWYLDKPAMEFWYSYCQDSHLVADIFDRFEATEDTLLISNEAGKLGRISSNRSTAACMCISSAYLISKAGNGDFRGFIATLRSLLDVGYVQIGTGDTEGILVGQGPGKWTINLPGYSGVITRNNQKDMPADGTLCLFGYDPGSRNIQPGAADHWVVVTIMNHRVIVVYDPYRTGDFRKAGDDLTSYVGSTDSTFAIIQKENEAAKPA